MIMKKPEHIREAAEIGADSWELIRFASLPDAASPAQQIQALKDDAQWQRDHAEEIQHQIDRLIKKIEEDA
jgi:hypothetical protein